MDQTEVRHQFKSLFIYQRFPSLGPNLRPLVPPQLLLATVGVRGCWERSHRELDRDVCYTSLAGPGKNAQVFLLFLLL